LEQEDQAVVEQVEKLLAHLQLQEQLTQEVEVEAVEVMLQQIQQE
jgi:hypothetical protein